LGESIHVYRSIIPTIIKSFPKVIMIHWIFFFTQYYVQVSSSSLEVPSLSPPSLKRDFATRSSRHDSRQLWGTVDVPSTIPQHTSKYSTVGFINLSKRFTSVTNDAPRNENSVQRSHFDTGDGDSELKITSLNLFLGRCIQKLLDSCESKHVATLCAIVPDVDDYHEAYCLESEINKSMCTNNNDIPDTDIVGDIIESLACVGDTIIIFYDVEHVITIHHLVLRLKAGIERQRQSIIAKGGHSKKKLRFVFFVFENMSESTSHEMDLREEISSLQDNFKENNKDSGGLDLTVDVIPFNHESLLSITNLIRGWCMKVQDKDVPLLHFGRFIRSVISNLSGVKYNKISILFNSLFVGIKKNDSEAISAPSQTHSEKVSEDNKVGDVIAHSSIASQDISVSSGSIEKKANKSSNLDEGQLIETLATKLMRFSDEVISNSDKSISWLESKQDDVLLNSEMEIPILQFAADADRILIEASRRFDRQDIRDLVTGESDIVLIEASRKQVLSRLAGPFGLLQPFQVQLQSLREYYGQKYEAVLEQLDDELNDSNLDEAGTKKLHEMQKQIIVEAAEKSTGAFQTAAENAIPQMLCNEESLQDLVGEYTYIPVMDGLIRDMMHASLSRQSIDEELDEVNSFEENRRTLDTQTKNEVTGALKWLEKLAARVVVFGVNYLQGWLAWQGIRKAAVDRDNLMPKFPLF